jgi:signal transduction histidine kinase
MVSNLRILILEDNPNDADLLDRELKKSGLSFTSEIVQTRKEFEYALQHFNPDLILSDYSLPSFDAVTAFRIKQNKFPHIPFIIVSGIIGEENAVELIKNGVTDYTPKDKLFSLSSKINRALKDSEQRKEKQANDEKLKIQAQALTKANQDLVFQITAKEKSAADLIILTEELKAQKEELRIANEELHDKAQLLQRQEEKLIIVNEDLLLLNQILETRVFERTVELENLNRILKNLNLTKDKFLSIISNDVRNPLTAMLISSQKLNRDTETPAYNAIQPMVKIIHRTSNKIVQQLNELLEWAQLQKDKTTINTEKLHLILAVDQSLELLKVNALKKNIFLKNEVPFEHFINADLFMFRSIIHNLVTNAIKYTPKGGLINVSAQKANSMVEISVKDSGIGMDEGIIENLFTNSASNQASGIKNERDSGLGLKITKDFVTQHGGTIKVISEKGKGTTIIFTIPEYSL